MTKEKKRIELRELPNCVYMKDNVYVQHILNQFSEHNPVKDIQCVITYTPSMFPYIEISKTSTILVWDEHLFNLFDLYIQIMMSDEKYDDKVRLMQNLSLLMLSHKFDSIPSLSYAFAIIYDYQNRVDMEFGRKNLGYYDGLLQQLKLTDFQLDISVYSRIFVLYHEMRHYSYEKNLQKNNEQARRYLIKIRHQIYSILNPFNMPIYAGDPAHAYVINEINYMIENEDYHVIEEFACDLFACFDLIELLTRDHKRKVADEVKFAYQIASTVSRFLNDSMVFFNLWEDIYSNRKSRIYRNYVDNAFSFYKRDREDITIDQSSVNYHFRNKLLYYCLYHHYNDDQNFVFIHDLFSTNQQMLLVNGQNMIIDGCRTEMLLAVEQENRDNFTPQQCRAEKDKLLHWY